MQLTPEREPTHSLRGEPSLTPARTSRTSPSTQIVIELEAITHSARQPDQNHPT